MIPQDMAPMAQPPWPHQHSCVRSCARGLVESDHALTGTSSPDQADGNPPNADAQTPLGGAATRRAKCIQPDQRRAQHGAFRQAPGASVRDGCSEPLLEASVEAGLLGPEYAARQHDVDVATGDPQTTGDRDRHHGKLIGQAVNDPAGDLVPVGRRAEDDGRELLEAPQAHLPVVHRAGDVDRSPLAEGSRHDDGKRGRRAATVARANRGRQSLLAEAVSPAPVTRQVADPGEARLSAVRADPHRVHAGAADDHHAPSRGCAGAQGGEGIVADLHTGCQRLRIDRVPQQANVPWKVRAGETEAADLNGPGDSGALSRLRHQAAQSLHGDLDRDLLVRDGRPANERQQRART